MIIDKIFKKSVTWLFSEAFVYQFLFIVHQFLLLDVVGSGLYGLSGAVFGAVYLLISCLLFGFEALLTRTFQNNTHQLKRSSSEILAIFYGQVLFLFGAILLLNLVMTLMPSGIVSISLKYSDQFFAALSNLKIIFWGTVFFEALHKMMQ